MAAQPDSGCGWPAGPARPTLGQGQVHVWCASLQQPAPQLAALRALLAADELERAQRFQFEHLRHHFIAGRGQLRLILSRYGAGAPDKLAFSYGPYGKPALAGQPALHFNLAHSGNLALLAIARQELGVDVEAIRPLDDREAIARHYFSAVEIEQLAAVPVPQRDQAFFACWTRKEAFLKATGDGLSRQLDSFSVTLRPDEPARFLHITGEKAGAWQLVALEPANGYIGALAVRQGDWQIDCFANT